MELLKSDYYLLFYACALLFSLMNYKKYFDTVLKFLPIIIVYTFLSEILGVLIRDYKDFELIFKEGYSSYNQVIFNIYYLVFFLYFYFVYFRTIKNSSFKKNLHFGSLVFIAAMVINSFFQNALVMPLIYGHSIGSVVLIYCIINYFLELKSKTRKLLSQNLLFWVSLGLLIFYFVYPFVLFIGFFDYELYQKLNLRRVHHISISLMYSCFIIGFIKMKRMKPVREEN